MRITPSNTENAMQRIKPWPKLSQWPIRGKENTFKNQWQLKQKPSKLRKARENAGDQVVIGVSFAFNWLRLWRDVFWATLRYSIENCSKVNKTYCAIHQIQIFPINSVIPPSNNRSQVCRYDFAVGCIPALFPAYYLANFISIGAIFNWALIISQDCFDFALLASLCDWFRKLEPSPQPIRCDLVARVFPHFRQFVCIYSEFSLANDDVYPCGDWPLLLLLFWHFVIQLKTALTLIQSYPSQSPLLLKKKCEILFS